MFVEEKMKQLCSAPLVQRCTSPFSFLAQSEKGIKPSFCIADQYAKWEKQCDNRFQQLKANEEELNRIFIEIYGLQDELTPEVDDKDVTVRRADLGREIRSLINSKASEDEIRQSWNYRTNAIELNIQFSETARVLYAMVWYHDSRYLDPLLKGCPICGGMDILYGTIQLQLEEEIKTDEKMRKKTFMMPGAYDRFWTCSPNRKCARCGGMWFNSRMKGELDGQEK